MSAAFDAWTAYLALVEGGLSMDQSDPGNWTGGQVGVGQLNGSNGGISAATYPTLDIATLTTDQIDQLRERDFWMPMQGDELPAPIAFMVADAAYMSGPDRATRQMQTVLNVPVDGIIGPQTKGAAATTSALEFVLEFASVRLLFLITLPGWALDKSGWTRWIIRSVPTALATLDA